VVKNSQESQRKQGSLKGANVLDVGVEYDLLILDNQGMQFPQNLFYDLIDLAPLSQTFPITIRQCMDFLVQTELCQPRKERSGGWLHPAMLFDGPVSSTPAVIVNSLQKRKKEFNVWLRGAAIPRGVLLRPLLDASRSAPTVGPRITAPACTADQSQRSGGPCRISSVQRSPHRDRTD
jgi:hypothetical protein